MAILVPGQMWAAPTRPNQLLRIFQRTAILGGVFCIVRAEKVLEAAIDDGEPVDRRHGFGYDHRCLDLTRLLGPLA